MPTLFSPLYTHEEKSSDKLPVYYQHTITYVNPIGGQIYSFATEVACDGNPAIFIALDPNGTGYYLLKPTPVK